MSCKPKIDNGLLDTIEFVAALVFALVMGVCVLSFFAFVINGGCAV